MRNVTGRKGNNRSTSRKESIEQRSVENSDDLCSLNSSHNENVKVRKLDKQLQTTQVLNKKIVAGYRNTRLVKLFSRIESSVTSVKSTFEMHGLAIQLQTGTILCGNHILMLLASRAGENICMWNSMKKRSVFNAKLHQFHQEVIS